MSQLSRRQQREQTRQHLLDTTVSCLVEHGYAGTTTQRVQERAKVSRGALLHHFGSKADLFVAATHHIAERQLAEIQAASSTTNGEPDTLRHLVAAVRSAMSGPFFLAGLELWMAARTDPALKAALQPAERKLGSALRQVFNEVAGDNDVHRTRLSFESLMMILRGLAVTSVLRDNETLADEIVEYWAERICPE